MRARPFIGVAVAALLLGAAAAPAGAGGRATAAGKGASIPSIKYLKYDPVPGITAIPQMPDPALVTDPNPTKKFNAYDMNVYETIHFPERQSGDESTKDAPGGALAHGVCPIPDGCANHMREFVKFWKKQMAKLAKPWGGAVRAYEFENVGSQTPPYVFGTQTGTEWNLQMTVPGSKYPNEMIVVSGHYDQTDSGPASAWDSAEGHATVFRIAKLMTDYWKKTGTQPEVTVKFSAWGGEESGTNGSAAFIRDNLLPFPNEKVRGYFNLDPCGGAFPAFYHGNPAYQVPMVMQLGNPANVISPEQAEAMTAFNELAPEIVGDVFNHLDDTMDDVPTAPEIFVSDEEAAETGATSQEDKIVTAVGGLLLFSSDYANFEALGIPIINLFPDMFGPHDDRNPGSSEGVAMLHTPRDNLLNMNALTGVDQTGLTPSGGWYKGLEMCAHIHSWFMLQPSMSSPVKRTTDPVAYFEVLPEGPAPIIAKMKLTFDASGSRMFTGSDAFDGVDVGDLKFSWNFGDGSKDKGLTVTHEYAKAGGYTAVLTVTGGAGKLSGAKDTMKLLIDVQ